MPQFQSFQMENLKSTCRASNDFGFQKYFNTGAFFYQNANLGQLLAKSENVEFLFGTPGGLLQNFAIA